MMMNGCYEPGNIGVITRRQFRFVCGDGRGLPTSPEYECWRSLVVDADTLGKAKEEARESGWANGFPVGLGALEGARGLDSRWRCPMCVARSRGVRLVWDRNRNEWRMPCA
jgi:hypothetical protein